MPFKYPNNGKRDQNKEKHKELDICLIEEEVDYSYKMY